MKKINKNKVMAKKLEGILMLKVGLYTVTLTEEEIFALLKDKKLIIKDGELECQIEV